MRLIISIFFSLFLLTGCVSNEFQENSDFTPLQTSIVRVYNLGCVGTGVIIKYDGGYTYILTVRHAITNESTMDLEETNVPVFMKVGIRPTISNSGLTTSGIPALANVVAISTKNIDLALIKVKGRIGTVSDINYSSVPPIGSSVYLIGCPMGMETTVCRGVISRYLKKGDILNLGTDIAVYHGDSGSPIFVNNKIVGIIQTTIPDEPTINQSVSGVEIGKWLTSVGYGNLVE